eukprot:10489164-Heterocapsa_arctica.AAC.1
MWIFLLGGDLLDLPGVLDHHPNPSQVLSSTRRGHCWRKNRIETMPGCRALGTSDLLPREP